MCGPWRRRRSGLCPRQEQRDVLDQLLANMGDTELNARMMALTEEEEPLKAKIAKVRQLIQKITVENAGIIYVHFRDSGWCWSTVCNKGNRREEQWRFL